MDIAAASMSLSSAKLGEAVSVEVLKKAMDTEQIMFNGINEMLGQTSAAERSVQPHLGGNFDVRI